MENQTNELISKRERREQEQQNRLKKEKRERQKEIGKRVALWGGVVLALVGMVWGLAKLGSTGGSSVESGGVLADLVTPADWSRGKIDAQVTLVEYSDFQCPACGAAEPAVAGLAHEFGDKLRVVYRNYPLTTIHPNAQIAAQAAGAAGLQGKFWELHDLLFAHQSEWAPQTDPTQTFGQYADQLHLDKNKFLADMNSGAVKNKIAADVASGNRSNVDATPTFFLNGKKVTLRNFSDLHDLVAETVKK